MIDLSFIYYIVITIKNNKWVKIKNKKIQFSNNFIQEFKHMHASIALSPSLFLLLLINSPDLENACSLGTEVEGMQI